jgi:hypothetical protein
MLRASLQQDSNIRGKLSEVNYYLHFLQAMHLALVIALRFQAPSVATPAETNKDRVGADEQQTMLPARLKDQAASLKF